MSGQQKAGKGQLEYQVEVFDYLGLSGMDLQQVYQQLDLEISGE